MKRREFVTLLGGAAMAWPLPARAQQKASVIGWLISNAPDTNPYQLRGFRQGLKESGHAEGENVVIETRWADNQLDRLPALAADLVRRRVALIATGGPPAALAAKAATITIPIVFVVAQDPVKLGLIGSLARPSGNVTGINSVSSDLSAKRLEILRHLVPGAARVAVLVNPANVAITQVNLSEVEAATRLMGLQIQVYNADSSSEIDAVFARLAHDRPDALFVSTTPFFTARRIQLVNLTARHAMPTIFPNREFSEAGGLISYGANVAEAYRQQGIYAGRLLKGTKPSDLPVWQLNRFELLINAQTARMLNISVPPSLLATADEVIE